MVGKNNVFIVQHPLELKNYERQKGFSQGLNKFIAWTPSAVDALRRYGVDYLCPGDLYPDDQTPEERSSLIAGVAKWCKAIDNIIANCIPEIKAFHIRPFTSSFVHKRIWFLSHATEIETLHLIKEKYQPECIYFTNYKSGFCSPFLRVIRHLATLPDWGNQIIAVQADNRQLIEPNQTAYFPDFDSIDATRTTWIRALKRISTNRVKSLIKMAPNNRTIKTFLQSNNVIEIDENSNNILVFKSTEDELEPILSQLLLAIPELNIFYWDAIAQGTPNKLSFNKNKLMAEIASSNELKELRIRNIPLIVFIHELISQIIDFDIDRLYRNVDLFNSLNKKARFGAVLTSHGFAISECIFQYCERQSIPCITCLHGGTVGIFEEGPFENYRIGVGGELRYEFVYGKLIAEAQTKKVTEKWHGQAEFVPVGSSNYSKLYSRLITTNCRTEVKESSKLSVCIVVGLYSNYIDEEKYGTFSSASRYELLYETVEKLQSSNLLSVTVKNGYYVEKYELDLFTQFPEVRFLATDIKLTEQINHYDLFILQNLSTPLFELACSSKPILLFNDQRAGLLLKEAEELINTRTHLVQSVAQYRIEIEEISKLGGNARIVQDKKFEDFRFYEKYCGGSEGDAAANGSNWIQKNLRLD